MARVPKTDMILCCFLVASFLDFFYSQSNESESLESYWKGLSQEQWLSDTNTESGRSEYEVPIGGLSGFHQGGHQGRSFWGADDIFRVFLYFIELFVSKRYQS